MAKILSVVGARPNFMKVGALHRAFEQHPAHTSHILHTGQHYDAAMSDVFFRQLELPQPDVYLGVGSGSHAKQTAAIMVGFEEAVEADRPDVVVVVGDVNSTVACALVCAKLHIPLVHVEAGLRSGDRTMPEEINRLVTDRLSEHLFVSEPSGLKHLKAEGVAAERIHFVGNVMIDSLTHFLAKASELDTIASFNVAPGTYALVTMHRPRNVDRPEALAEVIALLEAVAQDTPVIFPVHPRTRQRLEDAGAWARLDQQPNLHLTQPVGYLEFLGLMQHAGVLVTDSGGVQEETTYLHVPCITLRPSTERPVTIDEGTNVLMELEADPVVTAVHAALAGDWKKGHTPDLWDGHAADRVAEHLAVIYG